MAGRALFLDRDGVINVDHGYVHRIDDFEFVPGIFELCRQARKQEHRVFVITNQAGIGRGLYTEDEFHRLMDWVGKQFDAQGVPIDQVYFCPTHPTAGLGTFRRESFDRKPQPGMILRAAQDFDLDLSASTLIGDHWSDVQAGVSAGVGQIFLLRASPLLDTDQDVPANVRVIRELVEATHAMAAGTTR